MIKYSYDPRACKKRYRTAYKISAEFWRALKAYVKPLSECWILVARKNS